MNNGLINQLYKEEKLNLEKYIFKSIRNREGSEDVFQGAVNTLISRYGIEHLTYKQLKQSLFGIIRIKILIWKRQNAKVNDAFTLHRLQTERTWYKKYYTEIKKDKKAYKEWLTHNLESQKQIYVRKNLGEFKDMRFRENNPRDNSKSLLWEI